MTKMTYWLVGCVLVGVFMAHQIADCPERMREFKIVEAAAAVAVWPALIVAAVVLSAKQVPMPPTRACPAKA